MSERLKRVDRMMAKSAELDRAMEQVDVAHVVFCKNPTPENEKTLLVARKRLRELAAECRQLTEESRAANQEVR